MHAVRDGDDARGEEGLVVAGRRDDRGLPAPGAGGHGDVDGEDANTGALNDALAGERDLSKERADRSTFRRCVAGVLLPSLLESAGIA